MKPYYILPFLCLLPDLSEAAMPSYTLPGIVVTAQRAESEKKEVPQSMTVITEKDISRKGAGNLSEALDGTLGLDLSSGAQSSSSAMGGHQLMVRGMNTNETLFLSDGVRLADEDTSQTKNMYLLSRLNPIDIDRIEILRGPAGALYGTDAMGGVLQVITKKPGKAETILGTRFSASENSAYFRTDPGKMGRFGLAISGRISRYRPLSYGRQGTDERGLTYTGKDTPLYGTARYLTIDGLYDPGNKNHQTLRFKNDFFHEDRSLTFSDALYGSRGMTIEAQKNDKSDTDRKEWTSSLTYEGMTNRNSYTGNIFYSRLKKESVTTNDRAPFSPRMPSFVRNTLETLFPLYEKEKGTYETWGASAKDTVSYDSHKFTFGGEYLKNTYTGTRLADSSAPKGSEKGYSQERHALFLSDQWQVNGKLFLNPSLRIENGDESITAPSLGMTYKLTDKIRFKANYGRGYRSPSISEKYLHLNHMAYRVDGNPDLKAEKSDNYDISFEWEGPVSGKISYFHNKVKNLIDTYHITANRYTYTNRKRAELQGLELELSRPLNEKFTISTSYTYLDAKDTSEDTRLENRSRHSAAFRLSYDDKKDYGYTGELWDTWKGSCAFDGNTYSCHLLNISLTKHWGKDLSLSLGMYNMLDKEIDELYVGHRVWFGGMECRF